MININSGSPVNIPHPYISSFTPSVHGGVGECLHSFPGGNFGSTKGKLFFVNANDDVTYIPLNAADINAWTNTQITVTIFLQ